MEKAIILFSHCTLLPLLLHLPDLAGICREGEKASLKYLAAAPVVFAGDIASEDQVVCQESGMNVCVEKALCKIS